MRYRSLDVGQKAERLAEGWLKKHSCLKLVARNYRCSSGELDLIMQTDDLLVFVEVRFRKNNDFGGAAASVTTIKQQRLIKAAQSFLASMPQYQNHCCRFDVLAMSGAANRPDYQWLQDAFSAPD